MCLVGNTGLEDGESVLSGRQCMVSGQNVMTHLQLPYALSHLLYFAMQLGGICEHEATGDRVLEVYKNRGIGAHLMPWPEDKLPLGHIDGQPLRTAHVGKCVNRCTERHIPQLPHGIFLSHLS